MHTPAVLPCAYFAPLEGDFTFLFGFFVLKKSVRRSTFLVDVGKVKEEGTACKATFFSMPFPHLGVPVFPNRSLSKNALWTKLFSSADEINLHCGRKKFALRTKKICTADEIFFVRSANSVQLWCGGNRRSLPHPVAYGWQSGMAQRREERCQCRMK